jgi:HlyD family secretion protein
MHLSTAEVSPEYSLPPHQKGLRPEPAPPKGELPKRLLLVVLSALVGAIVFGAVLFAALRTKPSSTPRTRQSLAASSSPIGILRLNGLTEAVRMRAILAPLLQGQYVATLTITKLTPPGTNVKQGDVLVEFDRQSQIRDSIDKRAEYDKLVSQVAEEQAKEDAARAKDESEIKQAEDALGKAQLEMQKSEIISRIDAEKDRESLEEAEATLAQLRETFGLKRKAAESAVRILQIQRDRTRQIMLHARADAELLQIRAPIDGIVVLNTIWKQGSMGEVQEGDQLRPGAPFMQIVDPSLMQVRVLANQEDFLSLRTGQSARIHLDAYPELVFPGKLEEMAPVGRNGDFSSRIRTFAVVFSISGRDARLMPDLSAAVDVDLGKRDSPAVPWR